MRLRIDPESAESLGLQLVRQIRIAIAAGRVAPGTRLPPARTLAKEIGVNFHTVRAAYGALEKEGLLTKARHRGTFVASDAPSIVGNNLWRWRRVRAHVEGIADELADSPLDFEAVAQVIGEELRRALGPARHLRPAASVSREGRLS